MKSRWLVEFLFDYIPFVKDHQLEIGIVGLSLIFGGMLLYVIYLLYTLVRE